MNSRTKGRRLDGYYPEYVLFDIETTGLSPATDEIIELSAVKVSRGDIIDTFDTLIRPNRKIPRSATAINGITNDMVKDAPTLEQKLPAFLDFIRGYKLVGHNIHTFDTNFIYDAALTLCGVQLRNDYVDTLYMARKCLPQLSHHCLGDVCEYFGIGTEGAHRALNDCIMNQKCYEKLGELLNTDHEVVKDHVAYSDKEGNFYCRAAHGILNYKEDQQVCGRGCPCFVGTDEKGYPVCRYQSLESLEKPTRSPMVMYKRMQQAITDGYVPLFPRTQRMTEFYPAYAYAAEAHQGQMRKGTQIPYITHLLTTMNYCLQLTDDKDVLMAAILHDTIEDTDTTYEDILHHFGSRIADYVREETENKRENLPAESTWEIRKRETIEHLRTASIEVKMLVLSDKTANAESMLREWRRIGDRIWGKFNQSDKEKQAWYYRSCRDALQELHDTSVMKCFEKYIGELFG